MLQNSKSIFAQTIKYDEKVILYNSVYRKPLIWNKEKYINFLNGKYKDKDLEDLKKIHFLKVCEQEDDKCITNVRQYFIQNKMYIDTVYINVTNQCNLCCDYCLVGQHRKKEVLSFDTFNKFFKSIEEYVRKNKREIHFILYGGEPILEKRILVYVIDKLSTLDKSIIGIITNGTLLEIDLIKYLAKKGVYVNISLDGPAAITDFHRKFKDSKFSVYNRVAQNIEKIRIYMPEDYYALSVTITPNVLEKKEDFIEWIKDLKVKKLVYNLLRRTKITIEYGEYYIKATSLMQETYEKLNPYGIAESTTEQMIYFFKKSGIRMTNCAAMAGTEVTLDCDGRLYGCHGCYNEENYLGNSGQELKSIIKNNMHLKLPIFQKQCLECKAFAICGGGCFYLGEKDKYCLYMKTMTEWAAKEVWTKHMMM